MKNTPIPNALRFYRKQKNLTQWQVASYLGFKSIDRICKWEKGRTYPHVVNLFKLAKFYGVRAEDLYH